MFKPHYGDCSHPDCNRKGVLIPVKSGLCQYCNHDKKQAKKISGRASQSNDKDGPGNDSEQEQLYDRLGNLLDQPPKHGWTSRKMVQKSKSSNGKARAPILRTKKGTGQAEIFEEIAEERDWVCFVTGRSLSGLTATQFAHVLPKALNKYPLFKLYKKNIVILSDEIHYAWDFWPESKLREDRRFDKLFALQEELKEEYKLLKNNPE